MAFPQDVPQLATTRTRTRQPREPRALSPGGAHDGVPPAAGIGGPVVDFGLLGAGRPVPYRENWRWIKVKRNSKEKRKQQRNMRIWADDEGHVLFPPTRREDGVEPDLTEGEAAHAATVYLEETLDKYDHLGVRDLIADELSSLPRPSTSRISPDVFMGRNLAVVHNSRAPLAKAVACFPTGPVGCQLNVSPFLPGTNNLSWAAGMRRFVPCARPVVEFQTPILQVESSPVISINRLDRDASCLVIREYSFTHLFHMVPRPTYVPPTPDCPVELELIGVLSPSDTAGLRHVDVALDPITFGRALLVDECGGVWQWTEEKKQIGERQGTSVKLVQLRQAITHERGGFFRIAYGTRPGTALVMSRRSLVSLDIEGDGGETKLMELRGDGRVFTFLDKTAAHRGATFAVAVTTFEVVWVDECTVGPPVLSWRHEYGGGTLRDLDLAFVQHNDEEVLLLSSRSQSLIIVFHISSDPPIKSHRDPYVLKLPRLINQPLSSLSYIHLQKDQQRSRTPTVLLGLSPDGSLNGVTLSTLLERNEDAKEDDRERKRGDVLRVKWGEDVQRLAEEVKKDEGEDDLRGTRYREMNLRWAWLEINKTKEKEEGEEREDGPGLLDMDEFEQYIRELDAPFENITTAAELARDVVHGPIEGLRSNLLRQLQADSQAEETRLPNISISISRHLPLISVYPLKSTAELDAFPPPRSDPEARGKFESDLNSLSLDLALSEIIVHSEEIEVQPRLENTQTSLDDPNELFARASMLSLNDKEPPRIDFGFLVPKPPVDLGDEDFRPGLSRRGKAASSSSEGIESLSARALLDEWVVGTDPSSYDWKPWRDAPTSGKTSQPSQAQSILPARPIRPLPSQKSPAKFAASQPILPQPPVIKTSSTMLPPVVRPAIPPISLSRPSTPLGNARGVARSSPPPPVPASSQPESQSIEGMVASTQVVRGPFGGRTGGGAKKKVKKRVGGF